MSLIARAPSTLSSSASGILRKENYGSQSPWSSKTKKDEWTVQPVVDRDANHESVHHEKVRTARYSGWDDDKVWSSQEWKADLLMDDRTGNPVVCPQRGARAQQLIIGDDEAELELSWRSRSFVNRVNDQVRKRQKRISNVAEDGEEFFYDLVNVLVCIIWNQQKSWERITWTIYTSNTGKDLTLKQTFDISVKMVSEQDDLRFGDNWLGRLFMEVFVFNWWWTSHQSWAHKGLRLFIFCIVSWQDTREPQSNTAWEDRLAWFKVHRNTETSTELTASQRNSSGIFPGFNTLQLGEEVKSFYWWD